LNRTAFDSSPGLCYGLSETGFMNEPERELRLSWGHNDRVKEA